jgi:hypothetical protein
MDASRIYRIREEMERAEARRLQPHYIESFFHEAFKNWADQPGSVSPVVMKSPMFLPLFAIVTV